MRTQLRTSIATLLRELGVKRPKAVADDILDLCDSMYLPPEMTPHKQIVETQKGNKTMRTFKKTWKVESRSRPGHFHTVNLTSGECSCEGYQYGHRCFHVRVAERFLPWAEKAVLG